MKLVSVAEMRAIEAEANEKSLTYAEMMENAGKGLGIAVHNAYSQLDNRVVLGLVGSGNNGGDTLVALAFLAERGWKASAYLVRPRNVGDPLVTRLEEAGGRILSADHDPGFIQLSETVRSSEVILDGVLGTGARLPLAPEVGQALTVVQKSIQHGLPKPHVVAVDCPSGVDCDTGEAAEQSIPAERTVTMAAVKRGLLHSPAFALAGQIETVDIGLPPDLDSWQKISREVADEDMIRAMMPSRPAESHKGTFGTALIVGGSVNYTGSVLLAGEAAYRIGTGLVTLAVPAQLHTTLAGAIPEATWLLLPQEMGVIASAAASLVHKQLDKVDALLLGPGWGLEDTTRGFLDRLLKGEKTQERKAVGFIRAPREDTVQVKPGLAGVVVDADGLKLLAKMDTWMDLLPDLSVLTPHPGEMSILTGLTISEIQADRIGMAEKYSREWRKVVVLKGAFTVVAEPGGRTTVIPVATPALAKAGTGDVLAGMIVGLRAQGLDGFSAAVAGAWIHAQAGIAAAGQWGNTASVLAGDVAVAIALVLERLYREM